MTSGVGIPGDVFRITRNVITIQIVMMEQTRTFVVSSKSLIVFKHSQYSYIVIIPLFPKTLNVA